MKNIFRKGLTLLMVLCLLVPLFGVSVLAENTGELPIDRKSAAPLLYMPSAGYDAQVI